MNLIDLYVTEVTSEPYQLNSGSWIVDVFAEAYGSIQSTHVFCKTIEEANSVCVGTTFLG
jgi:hypothetical protein